MFWGHSSQNSGNNLRIYSMSFCSFAAEIGLPPKAQFIRRIVRSLKYVHCLILFYTNLANAEVSFGIQPFFWLGWAGLHFPELQLSQYDVLKFQCWDLVCPASTEPVRKWERNYLTYFVNHMVHQKLSCLESDLPCRRFFSVSVFVSVLWLDVWILALNASFLVNLYMVTTSALVFSTSTLISNQVDQSSSVWPAMRFDFNSQPSQHGCE